MEGRGENPINCQQITVEWIVFKTIGFVNIGNGILPNNTKTKNPTNL